MSSIPENKMLSVIGVIGLKSCRDISSSILSTNPCICDLVSCGVWHGMWWEINVSHKYKAGKKCIPPKLSIDDPYGLLTSVLNPMVCLCMFFAWANSTNTPSSCGSSRFATITWDCGMNTPISK